MNVLSFTGTLFVVLVVLLFITVHKANTAPQQDAIGYGLFFVVFFCSAVIDFVIFLIALLSKVFPR